VLGRLAGSWFARRRAHFAATQRARRGAHNNRQGLTKRPKSTKIGHMNCLDIRIALIISIIHRMVG
jgi:hypothetical protein